MYSFLLEFLLGKYAASSCSSWFTYLFSFHVPWWWLCDPESPILIIADCHFSPVGALSWKLSIHGYVLSSSLHPSWTNFLRSLFSVFFFVSYKKHSVCNPTGVPFEEFSYFTFAGEVPCWFVFSIFFYISCYFLVPFPYSLESPCCQKYWYSTFCTLLSSCVLVDFLSFETEL